ncbi:hypothetical protein GCM10009641_61880 [Mycobacterium cookii]|uniref:Uncharacterized protein n=1 Tax=Nocardioides furvisabuli TaxID=375542 RepID=A0ABN2XBP5_9ACTN|nr:hypothetical protein [Nocardioides furvisabuli]
MSLEPDLAKVPTPVPQVLWEIFGHEVALTGDGYLDPDNYDPEFNVRCLECVDQVTGKVLTFYTDEFATYPVAGVDHNRVLRALADHLTHNLAYRIPAGVVDAAIMLASLSDDVAAGIELLGEHLTAYSPEPS